MTTYGRNEANAIFEAGDAAFTVADSTFWGEFNDKNKSLVAGKVGMAKFPYGPRRKQPISWDDIWGWAIPKSIPAERKKLAKEMLSAMMNDEAGQIEMWKKTGGPPPNIKLWPKLAADDKDFAALKHAVFDQTPITHSAYYFAEWPAVHKAYSDMAIAALSVGVGQACLDAALEYAKERSSFGRPISKHQAIQFKLADMAMEVELSRLMTYRAAVAYQSASGNLTGEVRRLAAMAKLFSSETSKRAADQAVQIHGGYGFIEDYPVARYWRDVKVNEIGEGTSEVQRMLIARELGC